jgi:hypothetical protein
MSEMARKSVYCLLNGVAWCYSEVALYPCQSEGMHLALCLHGADGASFSE